MIRFYLINKWLLKILKYLFILFYVTLKDNLLEGTWDDVPGEQKFLGLTSSWSKGITQFLPSNTKEFVDTGESGSPKLSILWLLMLILDTDFDGEYGVVSSV